MDKWRTRAVVSLLAVIGLVSAARLMWWYWPGSFFHNAASGTWTALAWDFAHGEFYPPVLSATAFGGTRYMPLLFVLHGLLIRLHVDPIESGVLLMQGSVVFASLALYAALRAARVSRALAAPFAATPWATVTYQKFFTDERVDYLAAAFVVLGVAAAFMARTDARRRWRWCAATACVLATLCKMTELLFVIPLAYALRRDDERFSAARFATATIAACLLLFGALEWASAGRFLDNVQATISGGMHISDVWKRGVPTFLTQLVGDPLIGAPFLLVVCGLVMNAGRRSWSIADGYFLTAAMVTCAIYASPGTSFNHMVELQIAAALCVAIAVEHGGLRDRTVAFVYTPLVITLLVLNLPFSRMPSPLNTLRALGPHQRATVESIRAEFLPSTDEYLSLNPIVPVLLRQHPMVLDPFNLNLFVVNRQPAGRDFLTRLHARSFATIIVDDDGVFSRDLRPGDVGFMDAVARFWRTATPLVQAIGLDYEILAVRRPFVILRQRHSPPV